jgi:hypothetical protein
MCRTANEPGRDTEERHRDGRAVAAAQITEDGQCGIPGAQGSYRLRRGVLRAGQHLVLQACIHQVKAGKVPLPLQRHHLPAGFSFRGQTPKGTEEIAHMDRHKDT